MIYKASTDYNSTAATAVVSDATTASITTNIDTVSYDELTTDESDNTSSASNSTNTSYSSTGLTKKSKKAKLASLSIVNNISKITTDENGNSLLTQINEKLNKIVELINNSIKYKDKSLKDIVNDLIAFNVSNQKPAEYEYIVEIAKKIYLNNDFYHSSKTYDLLAKEAVVHAISLVKEIKQNSDIFNGFNEYNNSSDD